MELKQYIFPIYSRGTIVGQGFVADGYFITAAHVVKDFYSCFTRINGKRFELSDAFIKLSLFDKSDVYNNLKKENFYNNPLSKIKYIYIGVGNIYHDPKMMDIVLYPCNDIDSPLHLSEYIPSKGDIFKCYCTFEWMDLSSLNPPPKLKMVHAFAKGEEEGNYFYCDCNQYEGSSGSPLLKGNEVVGIMHGGNNNGLCAFLKAQVLRQKLNQMEFSLDFELCDLDNAIEYNDCKYSRDKKRLLEGAGNVIRQGTIIICNKAFSKEDYMGRNYGTASGNMIIPNSVKAIGESAFAYSDELESIEIPDSVAQIGKSALDSCHFLKRVVLSNSIIEIPDNMFNCCQSLSEITIPESITNIGEMAFSNCDSLEKVIIPSSVKYIGHYAFEECTSLNQIVFLGLLSEIDSDAFCRCESLSKIVIPLGTIEKYEELLPDYMDLFIEDENTTERNFYIDWTPVGDAYTLKEICDVAFLFNYDDVDGDEAEIIVADFSGGPTSLRLIIPLKGGSSFELKAGKGILNNFVVGEKIKIDLIYGQEMRKTGQPSIIRYDVWKSETAKKKYLAERG